MICLNVRFIIGIISLTRYSEILKYFTSIVGFGFLVLYFTNIRDNAFESSEKNHNVWWKKYRIYHSINYLLYSGLTHYGNFGKLPSIFLFLDFLLGVYLFNKNNQNKI